MTVIGLAEIAIHPETSNFANDLKSKIGEALKNPTVVAAAAITAATGAVSIFAKQSIDKFKSVGAEVKQLTVVTGGSAVEMSHLRFAAQQTGVSTDSLASGLKKLSVDMTSHTAKLKDAGIAYTDTQGKILPLDQTLANVAQKFAGMPNGVEKNTLAIQLFGKSGTDLIPILNKGKDGLAALSAEADKYGLTLTQGNLDAIKKSTLAHKDFQAAIDGLKVQIGANLLPVVTDLFTAFTSHVIPVITDATRIVKEDFGPILATVFSAVQTVVRATGSVLNSFWDDFKVGTGAASGGLQPIHDVDSFFFDLGVTFGIVKDKLASFVDFVRTQAIPWVVGEWKKLQPDVQAFWKILQDAIGFVKDKIQTDFIPKLKDVWDWIKNQVLPASERLAEQLKGELGPALHNVSAASIVPVLVGLGALSEALKQLQEFGPLATLFDKLGFSILGVEIPGIVVVGAIVALGAAAIYAYTHFSGFRDVVDNVANFLQATVLPKLLQFGDWVIQKWDELVAFTRDNWPEIKAVIEEVANFIVTDVVPIIEAFASFVIGLIDSIITFVRVHWVEIKDVIEVVLLAVGAIVVVALGTIYVAWTTFHDAIITVLKGAWEIISSVIQLALNVVLDIIAIGLDIITGHWGQAWDDIKKLLGDVWDGIFGILRGVFDIVKGIFMAGLDAIKFVWDNVWASIVGVFSGIWDGIKSVVSGAFNNIKSNISSELNTIEGWVRGMGGRISSAASGMWDGITHAFKSAVNAIIDAWNNLRFTIGGGSFLGANIPSLTLDTPNLPHLAAGGVVKAQPGGTPVIMGEGGSDEAIVPLNSSFVAMLVLAMKQAGVGSGGHMIGEINIANTKTLQENLDEIDRLTPLVPA